MYWLMQSLPWKRLAREQSAPLGAAFVLAESFYKFHSFALECGAFLATWWLFDAACSAWRARKQST